MGEAGPGKRCFLRTTPARSYPRRRERGYGEMRLALVTGTPVSSDRSRPDPADAAAVAGACSTKTLVRQPSRPGDAASRKSLDHHHVGHVDRKRSTRAENAKSFSSLSGLCAPPTSAHPRGEYVTPHASDPSRPLAKPLPSSRHRPLAGWRRPAAIRSPTGSRRPPQTRSPQCPLRHLSASAPPAAALFGRLVAAG